ncbi:ABC transporter ATP-binding protein [Amycolatopsis nivea]|uniref:ABC transporter ATP-binding protein n=1 Tax=Amycolatopsis nivea TaxID=1644109 RepID=UPI001070208C|nr:ATP-binding cassette domain-containing protein [Amycolatopsis nivea]
MVENDTPVVLDNVSKRFGSTAAVQSVSWAPLRGQVTALVGLNGAGKSTLMRIVTGLIRPTEGTVTVRPSRDGGRALSAMIEAPALFNGLTVRRNLEMHRILTGADAAEVARAVELAQIGDVLKRRAGTLSQGYRQRVAMAQSLLGSPDLLLLDEPTNALDPEAIVQLRAMIRTVADEGTAVVVSSHQLRELEGTADALALLHGGRILYDGPFDSFVGPPTLRVRVAGSDGADTARLTALLREKHIDAAQTDDGIRAVADGAADSIAQQIFSTAVKADIELIELTHLAPTLEEAFHIAIAGARS